jgi:dTDP-glucose pyrophosphorylase
MKYLEINPGDSISSVLDNFNKKKINFSICLDSKKRPLGTFTLGDFRRTIIHKISLDEKVIKVINKKYIFLKDKNYKKLNHLFKTFFVEYIPIIKNNKVVEVVNRKEFYGKVLNKKNEKDIDNPVIIMAGGKGKRLDPFTRILPKALIPINSQPIIKKIMDEFYSQGIKNFNITLNYKANIIKGYFYGNNLNYKVDYLIEKKIMGTAGSLRYYQGKFAKPFFVTNCDVIIKEKYKDILSFHKNNESDITIVAAAKDFSIPYGVCKVGKLARLEEITEKPKMNLLVNTGFYILSPSVLNLIPKNKYFDMDKLIKIVIKKKGIVKVFPITQNNWSDVGQWNEYSKTIKEFRKY